MAEGGTRPSFGNRYLNDPEDVFQHNAWDNVDWGEDQELLAREKVKQNSLSPLTEDVKVDYEIKGCKHWDEFYQKHQNRFFKDRHWLFTEFPELKISPDDKNRKWTIFEVGCGVGNTVFPILQVNKDPNLFIYCCDFADSAIKIVKDHALYNTARCRAFQCDITSHTPLPVPEGSLDLVVMIFVLHCSVIGRLSRLLRPGGRILFRDYGELDMTQLRFKKGQCMSENFYVRGDGTLVYFFSEGEVDKLLSSNGLEKEVLYVDKRLQVNRGKQLKMYRIWIQAKYRKKLSDMTHPLVGGDPDGQQFQS